ncbi:MAG: PadR family transcriptional regulator [Solirubrobacterales bacterium]
MTPARNSLSPFSYVILVLVGDQGAAPHDLMRMNRQGEWIYWSAADSRFYSEPKRLANLGYLKARREPGKTTERTRYTLTAKGRRAVAEWLEQPSGFIRVQNEPAARLNGADLAADERSVVRSLQGIRPAIDEQLRWLERADEIASTLPHRERYLRLNHRLSRRILGAYLEWLDEVERELS